MKTKYYNTVREHIVSNDTRYMLIGIRGHYTDEFGMTSLPYGYIEYHSYNSKTIYYIR